ncbi:MAG TPA: HEAT repeat domain-containing protein [Anaerolineae bacterium]|nr:HEAT repeat domain-containing protein [Anaerolineae bacterium]
MLTALLLAETRWRFDLWSAVIGALIAWVMAAFLYTRRAAFKAFALKLWAPLVALRARLQSSQEERYVNDLQEALRGLLLFDPVDPQAVFRSPTFQAPAPITTASAERDDLFAPLEIHFDALLEGHPRLLLVGPQASGRTMTLVMAMRRVLAPAKGRKPYTRFPLWLDLNYFKDLPNPQAAALDKLATLASLYFPSLTPQWALTHLRREPALILVDNWEALPPNARDQAARWLVDASHELPDSIWLIATGVEGYGLFVEAGFVPLTLAPAKGAAMIEALYGGWAAQFRRPLEIPPDLRQLLIWADQSGAPLLELNLRIVLFLLTGQAPDFLIEVLDYLLDIKIPMLNMGEGQETVAEHARTLAIALVGQIAREHRLEGRVITKQGIGDRLTEMLPPEEERHPRLESAARKLIFDSGFLMPRGKTWEPSHYLWEDFLTAWHISGEAIGPDMFKAHLHDPTWTFMLEFYVALGDVSPLVNILLHEGITYQNDEAILRAARWATLSPDDIPWRKDVIKTLAQVFADPDLTQEWRLRFGRSLSLVAGADSAAFFLSSLRHRDMGVRCAALRGIGWIGGEREVALLEGALKEPDLEIAQSAVEALADMGTPEAATLLNHFLPAANEHLILPIARALAQIPEGYEMLRQAAESEDFMLRRAAAHGLDLIEEPWAETLLQKMAREDDEWLVRSAAETALHAREEKAAHKVIAPPPPKVESLDWLIAWAASQGVGMGVGAAAIQMLLRAVAEGDAPAKTLGALTLGQIGSVKHLPLLEPLLEDETYQVKYAAAHAIEQIQHRYAVEPGT